MTIESLTKSKKRRRKRSRPLSRFLEVIVTLALSLCVRAAEGDRVRFSVLCVPGARGVGPDEGGRGRAEARREVEGEDANGV